MSFFPIKRGYLATLTLGKKGNTLDKDQRSLYFNNLQKKHRDHITEIFTMIPFEDLGQYTFITCYCNGKQFPFQIQWLIQLIFWHWLETHWEMSGNSQICRKEGFFGLHWLILFITWHIVFDAMIHTTGNTEWQYGINKSIFSATIFSRGTVWRGFFF